MIFTNKLSNMGVALAVVCASFAGCVNVKRSDRQASPSNEMSKVKFNSAVRSLRRGERWGRYAQSVEKMKNFLKTEQLSESQKFTLLEYITVASSKLNEKAYLEALNAFKALPDSKRKKRALSFDMVKMTMPLNFRAAEKLYAENSGDIDVYSKLTLLREFAKSALWTIDDKKTFDAYWAKVKSLKNPFSGKKGAAARFESRRRAALANLVGELSSYDPAAADRLLAVNRGLFDENTACAILAAFAKSAVKFEDRRRFDANLAKLRNLPVSPAKIRALLEVANALWRMNKDLGEKILRDELKNAKLTDDQRFALLGGVLRLRRISGFNYGFSRSETFSYKRFKSLIAEMEAIVARGKIKRNNTLANFYHTYAKTAVDFGDYENGAKAIAKAYAIWPSNNRIAFLGAESAMRSNNAKLAETILSAIVANKRTRENDRLLAKALILLNNGSHVESVEKAWSDKTLKPAEKMNLLREVSTKLYRLGRYDDVRKLDAMVQKMFKPLKVKTYACQYVPDCPKNADSWAHSKYYDDWAAMETRFVKYGDGYCISKNTDVTRHLKGSVEPKLDPAYKTGVRILRDDSGVHIFARCDDPKVKEVTLGDLNGDSLEFLLKPGENSAYHSWYFELPGTKDVNWVNWETPGKHYRMTYDYFKKDSATTPDGFVAHTFIPWMMFYDKLPSKNNKWLFGMQRFGRCRITLSGLVHELGRAVELKFNFTKKQLTKLKRDICKMAFNNYRRLRDDKRGKIQIWKDDKLGDPEFFKTEVEPLLKKLDIAGSALNAPAKDEEIDAIFAEYVQQWAEISYIIADKRVAYLKKQLLK